MTSEKADLSTGRRDTVAAMEPLRVPIGLEVWIDERPVRCDARWSVVGPDVLVLETAVPDPSVALTLTSTFLACPGADTIASHASAIIGRAPRSWTRRHAAGELPVAYARDRCLLEHLSQLQDTLVELGRNVRIEVAEGSPLTQGRPGRE